MSVIIVPGGFNITNTNNNDIETKYQNEIEYLNLYNQAVKLEYNDINKAIQLYNESIDHNPKYLNSYLNCAKLYIINKDIFNAFSFLTKVIDLDKNNYEAIFLYADLLDKQDDIKLAKTYYTNGIKILTKNNITNKVANYIYSYALFNYYNDNTSEAKKYFLDIIKNKYNPNELTLGKQTFVYYYYADILYNEKHFINFKKYKTIAMSYYVKAANLGNINACLKIAFILMNKYDYKHKKHQFYEICNYLQKAISYGCISALYLYADYVYNYSISNYIVNRNKEIIISYYREYNNYIQNIALKYIENIALKYIENIIKKSNINDNNDNNDFNNYLNFIEADNDFYTNLNKDKSIFIQINNLNVAIKIDKLNRLYNI